MIPRTAAAHRGAAGARSCRTGPPQLSIRQPGKADIIDAFRQERPVGNSEIAAEDDLAGPAHLYEIAKIAGAWSMYKRKGWVAF